MGYCRTTNVEYKISIKANAELLAELTDEEFVEDCFRLEFSSLLSFSIFKFKSLTTTGEKDKAKKIKKK